MYFVSKSNFRIKEEIFPAVFDIRKESTIELFILGIIIKFEKNKTF